MTTVHDLATCAAERRNAVWTGAWCGAAIALIIAGLVGAWAAGWQEEHFAASLATVQAQHEMDIANERARVARYAEIDLLARQYDAMTGRE